MPLPLTESAVQGRSRLKTALLRALLIAAAWLLLGLLIKFDELRLAPSDPPVRSELLWWLLDWHLYLLLVPAILWMVERCPFTRGRRLRHLAFHLAAAIAVGTVSLLLTSTVRWLAGSRLTLDAPADAGFFAPFHLHSLLFNLCLYTMVAVVAFAFRFWRRIKQRELEASQLERSLAEARLEALQLRLQPHFLFNTLNSVAALIPRDPDGAERVIARLSELLRFLLQQEGAHEVALATELELLDRYLDIETTRFGDRLTVEMDVAPETRNASVPSLVLQPLVENAVRHGIARVPGPGTVTIGSKKHDDRLVLTVEDSGPGLREPPEALTEGTGLATTRRRLAELYGDDQTLELGTGERGGLRVTVELPFRQS